MIDALAQTFTFQSSIGVGDPQVYCEFMTAARQNYKNSILKQERNLSGYRAPGILKVIGGALKKRLCLVDMAFMLEDEEADGVNKFQKIKDRNRRILSLTTEVNGALYQTREKVVQRKAQNEEIDPSQQQSSN